MITLTPSSWEMTERIYRRMTKTREKPPKLGPVKEGEQSGFSGILNYRNLLLTKFALCLSSSTSSWSFSFFSLSTSISRSSFVLWLSFAANSKYLTSGFSIKTLKAYVSSIVASYKTETILLIQKKSFCF